MPSLGFIYALDMSPGEGAHPTSLDASVLFATDGDARRAVEGRKRLISDPKTAPALRRALERLAARQQGDEVIVNAAVLFDESPEGRALYGSVEGEPYGRP